MPTKDELIEEAKGLGIELDANETKGDLEAKIALHKSLLETPEPPAPANIVRRKINRGSSRRIENALTAFESAVDAFIKEMDLQIYEADEEGERTGEWSLLQGLRDVRNGCRHEVNEILHPAPAEDPAE